MKKYEYAKYWNQNFLTDQTDRQFIYDIISLMKKMQFTTVLELGSGVGNLSKHIKENFPSCHLTGIDIVKGNEYLDEFTHADITRYDTEKTFDVIVARCVLLHIRPEHIDRLVKKLLKWSKTVMILDYDPINVIPLADHNFRHDFTMFPHKLRLSPENSLFYTDLK